MALTPKQKLFVKEYLVDLNAKQAAIRAGYSVKTAEQQASRLLSNVKVQEAIQKGMDKRAAKVEVTAEMVLQHWYDLATADPNEVIHHRRVCCRHCFGHDFEYQWTDEAEYEQAVNAAKAMAKKGKPPVLPSDAGGYGFDPLIRPHPKCPQCHGEGHGQLHAADTRDLSPKAKKLYAGAKYTAQGLEIKLNSQEDAWDRIARHLGMYKDELKLKGELTVKKLEDLM
ncbi:terminase small subunit [Paenibacillus sonchi]|uniref:terminase small subunit n=1 Tax=Paenibacillus sonchi TaxID=373687 RepID=UPI001E5B7EEC|nr:terminase small subunit [Paenibacillus sonchi]MCE3202483.1 terminase small subunit [Paenibacillus sonchi]